MTSDLHLPSFIEGMTALYSFPLKTIAAEMGYSENYFTRIHETSKNDLRFAVRYIAALARLDERQKAASNRTR